MPTQEMRIFYVLVLENRTREIFRTQEHAEKYADRLGENYNIVLSEVRNWWYTEDGEDTSAEINYNEYKDTFKDIITIAHYYKNI